MSDSRPIGIFDSGVGGLTVLDAIARRLPAENLLYLGDTARLPYGTKSRATVRRYALKAVSLLLHRNVKAVVVACNTATALALDAVSDLSSVPVLGVIAPGAEVAVAVARESDRRSGSRTPIAVLATEATVSSDAYGLAIKILDPTRNVLHVACPLFVPLAEEGWTDNEVALAAASRYLAPVASASARVVVLGCTHYPLLRRTIEKTLPAGTLLVDSAESTARQLEMILTGDRRRDSTGPGETHLLVTDTSDRLRRVAGSFLGREEVSLELVDLP